MLSTTMNLGLLGLLIIILPAVIGQQVPTQCTEHRTFQNERWRSLAVPSDGTIQHCDSALAPAWYRILPIAGTDGKSDLIWKSPDISLFKCGTKHPMYLNAETDPVPTELYDTVQVGACFFFAVSYKCLPIEGFQVEITNCGDFNVYKLGDLKELPCPAAFCTSVKEPCPAGKFSNNGFEPGCTDQVPILIGKPVVESSVDVANSELVFTCNDQAVRSQNNFEQTRRIRWFMTRADDLTGRPTLVHEEKGPAAQVNRQLKENDWRHQFSLGVNITCEIKGFTAQDIPGNAATSDVFFAGLKVASSLITIRGNNRDKVKITSTVPILCPKEFIAGNTCTKNLRISVITRDHRSTTCSNGDFKTSIVVPTSCGTEITPAFPQQIPTDQSTFLNVQGRQPDVFNGNAASSLILSVREQTGFGIWKQKLPDVQVQVLNENSNTANKICRSINDPHMRTFANRAYELQEQGTFILYKHEALPLQVQAMYRPCSPTARVFCNCGIAVQSGKDVFIYDLCEKQLFNRIVQFLRVGVLGCDNKAMVINKQADKSYSIILPTGTKIYVSPPYQTSNKESFVGSIRITASTSDFGFNTIGGVCGVIVPENGQDLKPKDGNTAIQNSTEFYRSWKVLYPEENLFLHPDLVDDDKFTLPSQCECKADPNGQLTNEAVCDDTVAGTRCQIKDDETLLRVCKQGKRRKREILEQADLDIFADKFTFPEEDFENLPPPTFINGWTEERAIEFCRNFLTNNAPDECLALSNLNIDFLQNGCVLDIKAVGSTDFALGNLASLLRDCVIEVVSNNTKIVEVDPSESVPAAGNSSSTTMPPTTMKPISAQELLLKRICPAACSMRGTCIEGQCQCNDGFSGADCGTDLNTAPSNLLLLNNGVCDLQSRSCLSTIVFGQDISTVRDVGCVIKEYVFEDDNGHQNKKIKSAEYTVPATVMSAGQVRCTLRRSVPGRLVYAYDIALTNGGNVSEPEQMIVFDSNCYSKSEVKHPVLKDDVCVIDSTCHAKHDLNTENDQEFCKPEDNQFTWTVQPVPSNLRLLGNGVCDILNSSCLTPVVSAQDISSLTSVSCVIKEYVFQDSNGHQNSKFEVAEYTVPATAVSAGQVRCTLRRTVPGRLVYTYDIALTNGGDNSESERFILLETNCISVTENKLPALKYDACVINSTCYTDGAFNPENDEELCKPEANQFAWSPKPPAITNIRHCLDLDPDQQLDCALIFIFGNGR